MNELSISNKLRKAFREEDETGFENIVKTLEGTGAGNCIPLPRGWVINNGLSGNCPIGVNLQTTVRVLTRNLVMENGRVRDYSWILSNGPMDILAYMVRH